MADSYVLLPEYTTTLVSEALPKAKQAAQKASELDSALAKAHASLGYINYVYEWNFAAADNEFRKSIELNPNYTTAHQWYAEMLTFTGRNDEALTQAKKAVELEPLSALQKFIYGVVLYDARKYDEAAKQVDAGLELDPDFARLNQFKAQNAIERGDFKGALEACQKAMAADARVYKYCPALVYAKQGDRNRAYKTISGPLVGGAIGESNLALIYALLGDKDKAFESLDKLYREKSAFVVYSKAFPSFDNLRGDPRYKDLLKKVGLPE